MLAYFYEIRTPFPELASTIAITYPKHSQIHFLMGTLVLLGCFWCSCSRPYSIVVRKDVVGRRGWCKKAWREDVSWGYSKCFSTNVAPPPTCTSRPLWALTKKDFLQINSALWGRKLEGDFDPLKEMLKMEETVLVFFTQI